MAEEAATTQTDQSGITRTADGTIATEPVKTTETTTQQQQTTQQTEQKSQTEQKAAEGDDKTLLNKDAKKEEPKGAPEKYEDYKVPEGFTLDPEIKTEVDKLFKGMNLSQSQAQELVNFYTERAKEAFEAPFNAYQDQRKEWRTAAEANPELKGKLSPGGEVLTTIGKALESLGDSQLVSDFREAMELTGVGDNPAFILTFFRMAQRLTEGSHVTGRGPATSGQQRPNSPQRSVAQELWPNLPSANRG